MGRITIVGTGWEIGQLTLDAVEALKSGARIILHTDRCGCAEWLSQQGIEYESLDALYDSCEDFDEHARLAAAAVKKAAETGDVVYCVADVRDRSVLPLVQDGNLSATVLAGPPAEGALLAYASGEFRAVEASDWEGFHPSARECCLVREIDGRELAACVKLKLMEVYPEESAVWLMNADSAPISMPLYELDRAERYDHRTCALVPAQRRLTALERYDFEHLNEIMRILCGPDGCPWDRAQTHASLRTYMLEEAYEVIDAIDGGDPDHLYDELGDMLLQVALHAEIARKHGEFEIGDVTTAICEKMLARHTHVFGADTAEDSEQVVRLWNRNKMAERGQSTHTEALKGVTRAMPALLRAVKVLKRSADAGLCDKDAEALRERLVDRLRGPLDASSAEAVIGGLLMDIAGLSRLAGVDPEIALNETLNRFIARFEKVETEIVESGRDVDRLDAETLKEYWDLVKL